MRTAFREEQRLSQWWVRVLVLIPAGMGWWVFLTQVVGGDPGGERPASDWAVWVMLVLFGVGLPLLILLAKLVVTVDRQHVRMRWIPLAWRTIRVADIKSAEARTYRPIREYGGWGIRWSTKNGVAWNAVGNRGVQLELRAGKRLLIGSQRPEELEAAIRKVAKIAS